ncbi:transposase [Gluconobacter wancherniae]|uniref:transposase n=1 Tax=Gluconobacter wancherniae TaxID=1307955 RepID=UPI002011D15E|nr:transposase [Gluconobacter wancherniae]
MDQCSPVSASALISPRRKQGVSAKLEDTHSNLKAFLESQISELEHRIKNVIAEAVELVRPIPGIGRVAVAMLLAEMPELGRMMVAEAAAMIGLAPMAHDSDAMRRKRVITVGRRFLHNP